MNSVEGNIIIYLHTNDRQVNHVHIQNQRNLAASKVLLGKSVDQATQMVPLLFSLCSTAQTCVAVAAIEQATNIEIDEQTRAQRAALVRMETLREQIWRVLIDWPWFIGEPANHRALQQVIQICEKYKQLLAPQQQQLKPGGHPNLDHSLESKIDDLQRQLSSILEQNVFALPLKAWLELQTINNLIHWSARRETSSARLISHLQAMDWEQSGKCPILPIPVMDSERLHYALQLEHFIQKPRWHDRCHETGNIARCSSELIKSLQREFGNGLLTRLTVRLTEVAQLTQRMADLSTDQTSDVFLDNDEQLEMGTGLAHIMAARGQLTHQVKVANDVIQNYKILAPTEWNFHPEGVVASSLSSLTGKQKEIELQTRLLINCVDPCVGYQLHITEKEPQYA